MARRGKATVTKEKAERKVLKRKRKSQSKKGDAFGRQIAKVLSMWWSDGKDEGVFRYIKGYDVLRGKVRKSKGMRTEEFGDITAADERGKPFSERIVVEIKKGYGNWSFLDIIDRPQKGKQVFEYFWEQLNQDVRNSGGLRRPILIFSRDRRSSCVALPKNLLYELCQDHVRNDSLIFHTKKESIVVMRLQYFLEKVKPTSFSMEYSHASKSAKKKKE